MADPSVGPSGSGSTTPTGSGLRHEEKAENLRLYENPTLTTHVKYEDMQDYAVRPGFSTNALGREIALRVNAYRVEAYPQREIWQYDVLIGKGDVEKDGTINAVWNSSILQGQLGHGWIFDGKHIAWGPIDIGQMTLTIDLDIEKGRESTGKNTFRAQIRRTKKVPMNVLQAYISQQTGFSSEVLEAINFLDHLLREVPSKKLFAIKRSFFDKSLAGAAHLGQGVDAVKGIFQSLRCVQGNKLIVNADVANTCFWQEGTLSSVIMALAAPVTEHEISPILTKMNSIKCVLQVSLERLLKTRVTVDYNNMPESFRGRLFIIDKILPTNARTTTFWRTDPDTRDITTEVAIFDYFFKDKQHRLSRPHLPCIKMTKGHIFPAEVCFIPKGRRYNFKLNEVQTSSMIKFAVTRPAQRAESINQGLQMLDWSNDLYHRNYGLRINTSMIETKARLLVAPSVEFQGGKSEKPGTSGRWRIDGKQFLRPNKEKLTRWACAVINNFSPDPRKKTTSEEAKKFLQHFIDEFKSYGGSISDDMPPVIAHEDIKTAVEMAHDRATQGDKPPQLLVFIINGKITHGYNRIKKNCENRFGVVSQVMQSAHIKRCDMQYIGNVLMKVFAKLGGFAFRANPNQNIKIGSKPEQVKLVPPKSMMIGVDVSHAGPGSFQPSFAAMTVSMDHSAMRFAAAVQTNGNGQPGHRMEMVTCWNLIDMFVPLLREWMGTVGGGSLPEYMFYFRDGVSEGEYQHVLQQEVRDLKHILRMIDLSPGKRESSKMKWVVTICSKRHHIRFFPEGRNGDRNGNAFPGTLVERDVTHPSEFDFYLCAHSAIQGTARPVHYHVLQNDTTAGPDQLIKMIYNLSYQYARSSTPVSMIPAVYYAHLASKRAQAHERREFDESFAYVEADRKDFVNLSKAKEVSDRTGKIMTKAAVDRLRQLTQKETPSLLGLPEAREDKNKIRYSMWYI